MCGYVGSSGHVHSLIPGPYLLDELCTIVDQFMNVGGSFHKIGQQHYLMLAASVQSYKYSCFRSRSIVYYFHLIELERASYATAVHNVDRESFRMKRMPYGLA